MLLYNILYKKNIVKNFYGVLKNKVVRCRDILLDVEIFCVTTPFLIYFSKREIGFDLPGPPIPIGFPDCNESCRVCVRFGFSFYISGVVC